jgi:hypothetical protein
MFDKPLRHPLKWWQFYVACLRYATTGAWGWMGNVSTVLAFAPQLAKAYLPKVHMQAASLLARNGYGEDLLWKVPLVVGLAILVLRLFTASFQIYKDQPVAPQANGPRLVLAYEHSASVAPIYDRHAAVRPLFITNDGSDTALGIRIESARLGEFEFRFSVNEHHLISGDMAKVSEYSEHTTSIGRASLDHVFTNLIRAKIDRGATADFTEQLPVRIRFADHNGKEYAVRYDLVRAASKRANGQFTIENVRVEIRHET